MKKKIRVLYFISGQDGVAWYRVYQPAKMINKLGLAKIWHNPFDPDRQRLKDKAKIKKIDAWYDYSVDDKGTSKLIKMFEKIMGDPNDCNFDAVVFQRADIATMFTMALGIKDVYKIPVIQEIDDDVFHLPGTNPAIVAYKDKPIEQNDDEEDPLKIARISLGVYDGYIVSTHRLKEFYENFSPTYVCPNSIDLDERKQKKYKKHKGFRIMFSSSASHIDGARFLYPVIEKFLKNHPDATFYAYKPLVSVLKEYNKIKDRTVYMEWVKPNKYWDYIQSFSPDVCLAPLTDVLFNRAKSNLRLLEYWTSGNNAVIASPVENYRNTIVDGWNGLFAKEQDEWYEKLEYLYKHPEERERLGKNGYNTVKKDYNLKTNARIWTDAINDIIRNYDPNREPPDQYTPEYTPVRKP